MDEAIRVALTVGGGAHGGTGRVSAALIQALARRPDVEVLAAGPALELERLGGFATGVTSIVVPGRGGSIRDAVWTRQRLGRGLTRSSVDLVHGTKNVLPVGAPPKALTVHDLFLLTRPEGYPLRKRLAVPTLYRDALRRADLLVCVSHAVAAEVSERWPAVAPRIAVIPWAATIGADGEQSPISALAGRRYALAVGDGDPRKNLAFLARIWPSVQDTTGLHLVAVGRAPRPDPLDKLVASGLATRVGVVDDPVLRWLYLNAQLVVFPSLAEGFGLPVAEAVATGTPVVASDHPAVVEASFGRGIHISVEDEPGWVQAIGGTTGTRTDPPAVRSWDDVAADHTAAYRRLLTSPRA